MLCFIVRKFEAEFGLKLTACISGIDMLNELNFSLTCFCFFCWILLLTFWVNVCVFAFLGLGSLLVCLRRDLFFFEVGRRELMKWLFEFIFKFE